MERQRVVELSPVRILDRRLRGGLGPGRTGAILARAGAGRTALAVHLGLDALLAGRPVFHVAVGQSHEEVSAWYAALLDDVLARHAVDGADAVRSAVAAARVIKTFPAGRVDAEELAGALDVFARHMGFAPALVIVDGLEVEASWGPRAALAARKLAAGAGAALWLTATTYRAPPLGAALGAPLDAIGELLDVVVRIEPRAVELALELVRGGDPGPLGLHLETESLRLGPDPGARPRHARPPAFAFTLLSGGAVGAETEFGVLAERWGVAERTFTFAGRRAERARGLVVLDDDALAEGDVSPTWLGQTMRRVFPDTPLFRKVLASIWHQVHTAGEVFALGSIQDDGLVTGGTGFAVLLGRQWDKPVFVYDQERRAWFTWRHGQARWVPAGEPTITRTRFCGTGTRFVTDDGRAALAALYERSFA